MLSDSDYPSPYVHLSNCPPSASWRTKSSKTLFREGTIRAVWVGCRYNGRIWKPLHCGPSLASHRKVGWWKQIVHPGQGKCKAEEATGWVGLTREHPVYRGGREKPKISHKPSSGRRHLKKKWMHCYKGIKTTYTNILSNDDVSHGGHPIILSGHKIWYEYKNNT